MIDRPDEKIPPNIVEAWLAAREPLPPEDLSREIWDDIKANVAADWAKLCTQMRDANYSENELRMILQGRQLRDYLERVRQSGDKTLIEQTFSGVGLADKLRAARETFEQDPEAYEREFLGPIGMQQLLAELESGRTLEELLAASWGPDGPPTTHTEN